MPVKGRTILTDYADEVPEVGDIVLVPGDWTEGTWKLYRRATTEWRTSYDKFPVFGWEVTVPALTYAKRFKGRSPRYVVD
jgi:hypothetical protein